MTALRRISRAVLPARLADLVRRLGPYAAIALLLPGGSLIALCLWMVRQRAWTGLEPRRVLVTVTALSVMLIFPMGA